MLYQNGAISIDEDFAKFGSKSYAIDKINTVDVRFSQPGSAGWIICGLVSGIFILSLIGEFRFGALVFGLVLGGISYILFKLSQVKTFKLFLVTSSSEAQAFETKNEEEIDLLRSAIESAIVQQRRMRS